MEPNKNIPETFFCELSHQMMKDPVLDRDGHTYEREVILEYIQKNGVSPINLQPLTANDLIPNLALKKTIENYFGKQIGEPILNDQEQQKLMVVPSQNDLQIQASSSNEHVLLSIIPPSKMDGIERTPSCVVVVIDVSGSMGDEAKIKTDADSNETYGFNTLDLVKHAIKTIIKSTNKNDKLALVAFSNNANVVLQLSAMDEFGRKKAYDAVDNLQPDASTNLWDGLYRGMEILRMRKADDILKNAAVLILTDGMPNVEPPRGHIPQLQKYKEDLGGELPGIINTFGFGYSLDSKLLNEIAFIGKGTYAFIPDGSFVGTIFVNSMSNLLSYVALNVVVEIDKSNLQVKESDLLKYYDKKTNEQSLEIKLGSVQFGQNKEIVLPVTFNDNENKVLKGNLKYSNPFGESFNAAFNCKIVNTNDPKAHINYFRVQSATKMLDAVDYLQTNKDDLKSCSSQIDTLLHEIVNSPVKDNQYIKDLVTDLKEQVSIALSKKEFYNKWGRHYLPSLARAHLYQQCNNFKDPGVQHFGGQIFQATRDKLDKLFLNLPAPEPSIKRSTNKNVQNMSSFYNSQGVCFHGDCSVLMMNGLYKLVKDIQKGDMIYSDNGKPAQVICVVQTPMKENKAELVTLANGLKLTPYHPVKINGVFKFPIEIGKVNWVACDVVYNFVLNEHHIMKINNIECVTLGHGLINNDVVKHEYFGTDQVIKDLQKIGGWENGLIHLKSEWIRREGEIGIINKISQI